MNRIRNSKLKFASDKKETDEEEVYHLWRSTAFLRIPFVVHIDSTRIQAAYVLYSTRNV